ncbi:MAG: protein kinase domain-containing protein [Actinomycetota bacterium]
MSYCLNPHCQKPPNPDGTKFCLTCGSKLLLKDRYWAIRPIGEGAFGRTLLAVDEDRLKTPCAIKQFLPRIQEPGTLNKATELFQQEAQRLHELGEHPQIPALLAYFEQDRRLYLVQEWIDGPNLLEELQQQGAFTEEKIRELLLDLLPVLHFIHTHQIVHRDIKPENIVRRRTLPTLPRKGERNFIPAVTSQSHQTQGIPPGQCVLVDFGIAKQNSGIAKAKTGTRTGTAGYAPIEQIRGGKAYPASDLYSLGVTCIHLLTGMTPDDLFDPLEGVWNWRSHLTQRGQIISSQFSRILDRLLKDLVKERYQSALEVLQDIRSNEQKGQHPAGNSLPLSISTTQETPQKINNKVHQVQAELAEVSAELKQSEVRTKGKGKAVNSPPAKSPLTPAFSTHLAGEFKELQASQQPASGVDAELASLKFEYGIAQPLPHSSQPLTPSWQCVQILTGHTATVNAIVVRQLPLNLSDRGVIVTASDDRKIKLWELETGQLIHTFFGHSAAVDAVAISPDGRILVSGGIDRKIIEWKLDKKAMIRELYSHFGSPQSHRYGSVHAVTISPDGTIVASGSADRSIKLWNLRNGELMQKLLGHSDEVLSISFCETGKFLASGSADQTLRIWQLEPGGSVSTLTGHSGSIYAVAFSPNSPLTQEKNGKAGPILASGSADETIKIWDLQTGALKTTLRGHTDAVLSVAISPDGQTLASGSRDGTVKLWNLNTGALLNSLPGLNPVAFSADGQTLVTGASENKILIWRFCPQ